MIGFWTYILVVVPGIVLVLTVGFVAWSRRDAKRITMLREEAAELRRRSFELSMRPVPGQATAHFHGDFDLGSEAYRRAVMRAQSPTY